MTNKPNKERAKNQINGIIKELTDSMAPKPPTSAQEQCLLRAKQVALDVGTTYVGRLKLMPLRPNKEEAFDQIWPLYRDEFVKWSKEDLLYICSLCHASIAVENLKDAELI